MLRNCVCNSAQNRTVPELCHIKISVRELLTREKTILEMDIRKSKKQHSFRDVLVLKSQFANYCIRHAQYTNCLDMYTETLLS